MLQPMALADPFSHTDFSRSFSLSILDPNGTDLRIETTSTNPVEFLIPRDPNLVISRMSNHNVTGKNVLFNYHQVNLTQLNLNLTYSIHFELRPSHSNLSYLLIYRFDHQPKLYAFDGSSKLFCSSNDSTKDGDYVHFLDNNQTVNHQFIIYAIREMTAKEKNDFCSNPNLSQSLLSMINEPMIFSSNYSIRVYQSGCFYLDSNNHWQSNGLLVSRENIYQCIKGPSLNNYSRLVLKQIIIKHIVYQHMSNYPSFIRFEGEKK
jgi:hypothetical protein